MKNTLTNLKVGYQSIPGYSRYSTNDKGWIYNINTGLPMTPSTHIGGRQYVSVVDDNRHPCTIEIARLVWMTYHRTEQLANNMVVHHIDGNHKNNSIDNLILKSRATKWSVIKLSEIIKDKLANGLTWADVQQKYTMSPSTCRKLFTSKSSPSIMNNRTEAYRLAKINNK